MRSRAVISAPLPPNNTASRLLMRVAPTVKAGIRVCLEPNIGLALLPQSEQSPPTEEWSERKGERQCEGRRESERECVKTRQRERDRANAGV